MAGTILHLLIYRTFSS